MNYCSGTEERIFEDDKTILRLCRDFQIVEEEHRLGDIPSYEILMEWKGKNNPMAGSLLDAAY